MPKRKVLMKCKIVVTTTTTTITTNEDMLNQCNHGTVKALRVPARRVPYVFTYCRIQFTDL